MAPRYVTAISPPCQVTCAPGPTRQAARTWNREYFFGRFSAGPSQSHPANPLDEEPGKRKHPGGDWASALLWRALGWHVGRESDPEMSGIFPHRDRRPGKIWVGKGADGYGDVTGKALALPVDR